MGEVFSIVHETIVRYTVIATAIPIALTLSGIIGFFNCIGTKEEVNAGQITNGSDRLEYNHDISSPRLGSNVLR